MNKKDRERITNAVELGKAAALAGIPMDSNPFKKSAWGVGGFWEIGWKDGNLILANTQETKGVVNGVDSISA